MSNILHGVITKGTHRRGHLSLVLEDNKALLWGQRYDHSRRKRTAKAGMRKYLPFEGSGRKFNVSEAPNSGGVEGRGANCGAHLPFLSVWLHPANNRR